MEQNEIKSPVEYIKESWKIYTKKENFIFFSKIIAVFAVISLILGFISGYFSISDPNNIDYSNIPMLIGFVILSLLLIILGYWSQTTQYLMILRMGDSEKEVLKLGFKKIIKFFVASFFVGLIVLLGILLLIIPGIMFGVWYSFCIWLVLDKQMRVFEALKTSKAMVKGRFWKIFGRSAVFGLFGFVVSIIISMVPYAGGLLVSFVAPLLILPHYLLYKDLVNNQKI